MRRRARATTVRRSCYRGARGPWQMVIAFILTEIVFHSLRDVPNAMRRNNIHSHSPSQVVYRIALRIYKYSDWPDDCWLDMPVNMLSTIIVRSSAYICEHIQCDQVQINNEELRTIAHSRTHHAHQFAEEWERKWWWWHSTWLLYLRSFVIIRQACECERTRGKQKKKHIHIDEIIVW